LTGLTQLSVHVYHATTVNEFTPALPPLQHLRKLTLTAPHAVISSEASAFSQLTALEQLSLRCDTLEPVALQQLTQLEDFNLEVNRFTCPQGQPGDAALPVLLAQLPHLTQLQISGYWDTPAGSVTDTSAAAKFAAITTSSSLQHLKLHIGLSEEAWRSVFSAQCQLPHLKSLDLDLPRPVRQRCVCSPANFPGFGSLSALQSLRLRGFDLEPRVLLKLSALQMLHLRRVDVRSAAQAAALMDALPQLKQLQLLAVDADSFSFSPTQPHPADPLIYASPSPKVFAARQHLKLGLLRLATVGLHGTFWSQLFAAQRLLPYLTDASNRSLNPADTKPAAGESVSTVPALASWMLVGEGWSFESTGHGMATKVDYVSTEELDQLVQTYPKLTGLAISLDPAGVQLDTLASLTDLRELSLSNAPADTPQNLVSALKATAELKVLHLWFDGVDCGAECSNRHQLQALTALTQLTRLVCGCCCKAACSSCPAGAVPGTLGRFEGRRMVSDAAVLNC
jgi:hypothetical protein